MIPDSKMLDLARKLIKKTRDNQAQWNKLRHEDSVRSCTIDVNGITVESEFVIPVAEPDAYGIKVFQNGELAGRLFAEDETENWLVLKQLFEEAERVVTGWDHALIVLETALDGKGIVGKKSEKNNTTNSYQYSR